MESSDVANKILTKSLVKTKDSQGRTVYNDKYVILETIQKGQISTLYKVCLVDQPTKFYCAKIFNKMVL